MSTIIGREKEIAELNELYNSDKSVINTTTGVGYSTLEEASDVVNGHILYVDGGILAYIGEQP